MRRIKNLFTVPADEKVTEKQLRRVIISSVCSILLCMTCLVSTTWAWFSTTITNEGNVIEIGTFYPEIAISGNDVVEENGGYLLETGTYTVSITNTGTGKGYCSIWLDGEEAYTSKTLVASAAENSVSFEIIVYRAAAKLSVVPHLGKVPGPVTLKETITVGEPPVEEIESTTASEEATSGTTESITSSEETTSGTTERTEQTAGATVDSTEGTEQMVDSTESTAASGEETVDPTESTETTAPVEGSAAPEQAVTESTAPDEAE